MGAGGSSGGGGVSSPLLLGVGSADLVKASNTVLADVVDCKIAIAANQVIMGIIYCQIDTGATNCKIGIVIPASPAKFKWGATWSTSGNGATESSTLLAVNNGQDKIFAYVFYIENGPNAGDIQLQFAQSASDAGDSTCFKETMIVGTVQP